MEGGSTELSKAARMELTQKKVHWETGLQVETERLIPTAEAELEQNQTGSLKKASGGTVRWEVSAKGQLRWLPWSSDSGVDQTWPWSPNRVGKKR